MTGTEALNLANAVLRSVGESALSLPDLMGTEREQIKTVSRAYAARLREKQPRFSQIKDDGMLPDMVIQKLREELENK